MTTSRAFADAAGRAVATIKRKIAAGFVSVSMVAPKSSVRDEYRGSSQRSGTLKTRNELTGSSGEGPPIPKRPA